MNHISLFSGIGGFDLASEWMGWRNVLSCEIADFPNRILEYYWPEAYHHRDIHTLTHEIIEKELTQRFGSDWRSDGVILTGGFPCQPFSAAGKRKGKEDPRHLWPEMLRVIRGIRLDYIVGENVAGLVNWSGGLVFEQVFTDLEDAGYEVGAFMVPACATGAPHRRDRIWFIAHSNGSYDGRITGENAGKSGKKWLSERDEIRKPIESGKIQRDAPNTNIAGWRKGNQTNEIGSPEQSYCNSIQSFTSDTEFIRLEHCTNSGQIQREKTDARGERGESSLSTKTNGNGHKPNWENFPIVSPICSGDDGLPAKLDGITFPKWRNESIKGYGNAVVPQVVYEFFKMIEAHKNKFSKSCNISGKRPYI